MSVTYTPDWFTLVRGQCYLYANHPYRWRLPLFLLLPLPFLILGNFMGAKETVSVFATTIGIWVGFFVAFLIIGTAGEIVVPMGKALTLTILPAGLRNEKWWPKSIVKWKEIVSIIDTGTDIFLLRNFPGAGMIVPLNAFTYPREAQQFYETAVGYWQSAKTGQPFMPADATGVWPPALVTGNSAESGEHP